MKKSILIQAIFIPIHTPLPCIREALSMILVREIEKKLHKFCVKIRRALIFSDLGPKWGEPPTPLFKCTYDRPCWQTAAYRIPVYCYDYSNENAYDRPYNAKTLNFLIAGPFSRGRISRVVQNFHEAVA